MTVPIACSAGRSGFGPELSLSYDSASGNGPFGLGWQLSVPSITRKTDRGLPRYLDDEDSDIFIFAGAEDLVPEYRRDVDGTWTGTHPGHTRDADGAWVRDTTGALVVHEDDIDGYRVRRYRPRIEGLFARIERWTRIAAPVPGLPAGVHWRSISRDNVLTLYGTTANSRIADPLIPAHIFSWLVCETRDDKGNAVLYRYREEDGAGVSLARAHERNRGEPGDVRRTANRYLKSIVYGNRVTALDGAGNRPRFLDPAVVNSQIANAEWMFEVVFDYGDHHPDTPIPQDYVALAAGGAPRFPWARRADPFSSYRAGFDVRTTRLCQRVLMFHHFPAEAEVGRDCLVRSTDFTYSDEVDPTDVRNPVFSALKAATQVGYRRTAGGGYTSSRMPPVDFTYSQANVHQAVELVDTTSLENVPVGLDGSLYRWADLHAEGVQGILTEQGGAWWYKRNTSPIPVTPPDGNERTVARFAPLEVVESLPSAALKDGAELMDLAGDGLPDVVMMTGPTPGLFEHDEEEGWEPFRSFTHPLHRNPQDPNLRFIDLDGDGFADVLFTEDDALGWQPSLGEAGFGPTRRVPLAIDEEHGPRVVFADSERTVFLADMNGDGLADIVRIRNGDVCYWPNIGYGRFGAKVTMDHAPVFDDQASFDPSQLRLADIDGSGTTDLLYLHREGITLYFNQSGNGWSDPTRLGVALRGDDSTRIDTVDLLGNGTACVVWSSSMPWDAPRQMRYVDLTGGQKPHLLINVANNLGAETRITFAPSTKFYLQDRRDGRPWVSRLPFPVHVVERVEVWDHVSRSRFVTRYAYHHGYFDGVEREFRGFGMVEQWDTEQFGTLGTSDNFPVGTNASAASHVPPIRTRTWYHTGLYLGRDRVSNYFAGLRDERDPGEYFREPLLTDDEARELLLPDTELPAGLTLEEEREACRALKGSMLRQEVYADDAADAASAEVQARAGMPYLVSEQNFRLRRLQPAGTNLNAVFLAHPSETISFHYERRPADPRIQHTLTLEVDDQGNVLKEASIGYGRRAMVREPDGAGGTRLVPNGDLAALAAHDQVRQLTTLVTFTEREVTNDVDGLDVHRNGLVAEISTFELTGFAATGPGARYLASDFTEQDPLRPARRRLRFNAEIPYEAVPSGSRVRRLIERVRSLYRSDDLVNLLPHGRLHSRAFPGESYTLAFTPGLVANAFQRPRSGQLPESLLPDPVAVLAGQGGSQGGYVASQTLVAAGLFPAGEASDHFWAPSGRSYFSIDPLHTPPAEFTEGRQHFFRARRHRDPFGHDSFVDFDAYDLLVRESRDALGNRVTVLTNDYRMQQARLLRDPNGNRSEVAFDTLGYVTGTAVMGKAPPAAAEGDSLAGFQADLPAAQVEAFFSAPDPHAAAATLLGDATTRMVYDVGRFQRTQAAHPNDPTQW